MDDLLDECARAIWQTPIYDDCNPPGYVRSWPPSQKFVRDELNRAAAAIIPIVLERAAKAALEHEPNDWLNDDGVVRHIADAIRALIPKEPTP